MPMNANILANMGTFSLAETIQDAEQTKYMRVRNELLGYDAERESEIAKRRKKRREIEELYKAMPARIEQYEKLGMHEEAQQTKEAYLNGKRQELAMFEIVAKTITADNWDQRRQEAIESGMIDPENMPVEHDQKWVDDWLGKVLGDMKEIETTFGELGPDGEPTGRTMTQDRLFQDGVEVEPFEEPYESATNRNARLGRGPGSSGGQPWRFSASDSNAMLSQAKIQFDAILDDNGNFIGIRGEGDRALAELMELAEKYMKDSGGPHMGLSHGQAIAKAGRKQGLQIKSTLDPDALNPFNLQKQ